MSRLWTRWYEEQLMQAFPFPAVAAWALVASVACGGAQSPPVETPPVPSCAVKESLVQKAIAAAKAADAQPQDPQAQGAVLSAAAELAVHEKTHHGRENFLDLRGALAVEPSLQRKLAAVNSCPDKHVIARMMRYLRLQSAKRAYSVDARACLSPIEAASTCGFLEPDDSLALVRELWPRANEAEKVAMLSNVDLCSNGGFDATVARLSFLSATEKAHYLPIIQARHESRVESELASMGADVGVAGAERKSVEACHDACMALYGEGGSLCRSMCPAGGRCGVCGELGNVCNQECDAFH